MLKTLIIPSYDCDGSVHYLNDKKSGGRRLKIVSRSAFSPTDLSELNALESACRKKDGAVRLEKETSLNAYGDMRPFYLAYEEDRLVGVLSVFAPLKKQAEIGAVVSPEFRRTGVFYSLLSVVELELDRFGYEEELFVLNASSSAGKAVAKRLGAEYAYTEYVMRYAGGCPAVPIRGLEISRIGEECIEELVGLRAGEFGDSREEAEAFERTTFASSDRQVYAAFLDSRMAAACSLGFQDREVSINGLVTKKSLRGHGYGQAFFSWIVRMLENQGLGMTLDVNSRNPNAYHIYKKFGFVEESAVEYHRRDRGVGTR